MDWGLFWSAVAATGEWAGAVFGGFALIYAIHTYNQQMQFDHYAALDETYADLLSMAVDKPWLRNPDAITDEEQRLAYEVYAFMVWNFLETIYDRCGSEKTLCETWYPIIGAEGRLHLTWFNRPDCRQNFKVRFQQFVDREVKRLMEGG